jgi:hypothetical protein
MTDPKYMEAMKHAQTVLIWSTSEVGRPLDVGEEECDRPGGKLRHAALRRLTLR